MPAADSGGDVLANMFENHRNGEELGDSFFSEIGGPSLHRTLEGRS